MCESTQTHISCCLLFERQHAQAEKQPSFPIESLNAQPVACHCSPTPDKPPLCFMLGPSQKENLLEDAANSDESAHLKATD